MSEWKVTFRVLIPNGGPSGCCVLYREIRVDPIEGDSTLEIKGTSIQARISGLWCQAQVQTEDS